MESKSIQVVVGVISTIFSESRRKKGWERERETWFFLYFFFSSKRKLMEGVRTFVNVTMYPQYNNNKKSIIKIKELKQKWKISL
jgi:hypothetical protein